LNNVIFSRSRVKRGQITLFVIIGLLFLIGAIFFFSTTSSLSSNAEKKLLNSADTVDDVYRPVQQFVEQCLYQTTKKSLDEIGAHGGYLDPLHSGGHSFSFDKSRPTESDGVSFDGEGDGFVPYWFYSQTPNADSLHLDAEMRIPELDTIKREHEDYIKKNLFSCLNDFKDFEGYSDGSIVINDAEPKITVLYSDDSVIAKAEFKLSISRPNGKSTNIKNFVVNIPIPFKKYYSLAKSITLTESTEQYLESLTLDVISRYSGLSSDRLPPFAGFSIGHDQVFWSKTAVKNNLHSLLQSFVPIFNVLNSKNYLSLNFQNMTPSEKLFFEKFTLPPEVYAEPSMSINHILLDWPIYMDVSPSNGELLTSSTDDSENYGPYFQKPAPDQNYRFFYDVSYPVIVSIHDENRSGNLDYTFNFALESNIKFNRGWIDYAHRNGPLPWDESWVEFDDGSGIQANNDNENSANINNDSSYSNEAAKLFFSEDQKISGNVTLLTFDKNTGKPLPDVTLRLGVGSMVSKSLGVTKINDQGLAEFNDKLPFVANAYIELIKDDYKKLILPITTKNSEPLDLGSFSLEPFAYKNTTIKIYDLNTKTLHEKEANDTVTVTLTRIKPDDGFTTTAVFKGNNSMINLRILPGEYSISGIFITSAGEVIPAKSKKVCDDSFKCAMFHLTGTAMALSSWDALNEKFCHGMLPCKKMKEENRYIPKEPIEMKPMMWGGVELLDSEPIVLSKESIYGNSTLVLKVLRLPHPKNIDDMNLMSQIGNFSRAYRSMILPVVENISKNKSVDLSVNQNI
jgi:hypothetical protein